MENFVNNYRDEALELLDSMESKLLQLEENPTDEKKITEVFRVMHTLKGTSMMFGFDSVSKLTHELETIYELTYKGDLKLTPDIISTTLEVIDFIKATFKENNQNNDEKEIDKYVHQLKSFLNNSDLSDSIQSSTKNKQVISLSESTYYIIFRPDEKIIRSGINFLNIFSELSSIGKYRIVQHDFITNNSDNELSWGIYLVTSERVSAIHEVFLFLENYYEVIKIAQFNIFEDEKNNALLDEISNEKAKQKTILEIVNENNETKSLQNNPTQTAIKSAQSAKTIESKKACVDSSKLNKLLNLVDELVTANSSLHLATKSKDLGKMERVAEKMETLTIQFKHVILGLKLVSFGEVVARFKRLMRDLSINMNKDIRFIIDGEDIEFDKNIAGNLVDPLMHILRNAVDHAIESSEEREKKGKKRQATIKLTASHAGNQLHISISDDGRGINLKKIKEKAIQKGLIKKNTILSPQKAYALLFEPGFSTTNEVNTISGRGIGLNVVKAKLDEIQGKIDIKSEPDIGTTFTLKIRQNINPVK